MTECFFCKIHKEKSVYENKFFFASFDDFPVSPGHLEIATKRHVASVLDLTEEEWKFLKPAISDAIKIIAETDFKVLYNKLLQNDLNEKSKWFCRKMLEHVNLETSPSAYNIGINEGEAAGRTIDHLHIHIIPRYPGDVENCAGGVRNIIPLMGNYNKEE